MQKLKSRKELSTWLKNQLSDADELICKDMLHKILLNKITKSKLLTLNILYYLKINAKTSDRTIAKKLKTSQSTVTRHRQALEKRGIVKQYLTIIDEAKLIKWIFGD